MVASHATASADLPTNQILTYFVVCLSVYLLCSTSTSPLQTPLLNDYSNDIAFTTVKFLPVKLTGK